MSRDVADQLCVLSEADPDLGFGPLVGTLDKRDKTDGIPTGPNRSRAGPATFCPGRSPPERAHSSLAGGPGNPFAKT